MQYHVTVTVKNGQLVRMMHEMGFKYVSRFAKASGIDLATLHGYINMTLSPLSKRKNEIWKQSALDLAEFLAVSVDFIFPESLMVIPTNKVGRYIEQKQLAQTIQAVPQLTWESSHMAKEIISEVLDCGKFNKREKLILHKIYQERLSLSSIARILNLSSSRIDQIHHKALKKFKRLAQTRFKHLRELYDEGICDTQGGAI